MMAEEKRSSRSGIASIFWLAWPVIVYFAIGIAGPVIDRATKEEVVERMWPPAPRLSFSVESVSDQSDTMVLSIRNLGDSEAVIRGVYFCETDRWELWSPAAREGPRTIGPGSHFLYTTMHGYMLHCDDMARNHRGLKLIGADRLVAPRGHVRLEVAQPRTARIAGESESLLQSGDDDCPIHLRTDAGEAVLIVVCTREGHNGGA